MPRKNKGMWYEVHPTPVKGKDGKNLVYVRPQSGMKLSMKQLEEALWGDESSFRLIPPRGGKVSG